MTRELSLQAENTLHSGDGELVVGVVGGGGGGGGIFWLMSIRYMVHSDKWGETTRYTEDTAATEKQLYEILMGYIYRQATVTSNCLQGLEGEGRRERGSLCLTDNR